jgi:hypothetical protein
MADWTHKHRAYLTGQERRRAIALGDPVSFEWTCREQTCDLKRDSTVRGRSKPRR